MGDLLLPLAVGTVAALLSLVAWRSATAERRVSVRRPSDADDDELLFEPGKTRHSRAGGSHLEQPNGWRRIGALLRIGWPEAPRDASSESERPALLQIAFDRVLAWLTGPEY
jgi:hypothetical protein